MTTKPSDAARKLAEMYGPPCSCCRNERDPEDRHYDCQSGCMCNGASGYGYAEQEKLAQEIRAALDDARAEEREFLIRVIENQSRHTVRHEAGIQIVGWLRAIAKARAIESGEVLGVAD